MSSTNQPPSFAVVGRPNKGKSSVVATLARDDSVYIDAAAGSTREVRYFPMRVNGETLYTLVDTPGIQRARQVLEWLRQHCSDAAARPATVRLFVEQHASDAAFADEVRALQPLTDGAGIIYVVDGSVPYGQDYEAEMEILRWTGRPSLALVNPVASEDYVEPWVVGLGQYFQTVRVFDAHRAEHRKQLDLLALFGHLDQRWRAPLQRAVAVLQADRQRQHLEAAEAICALVVEGITHTVSQAIPEGAPEGPVKTLLFSRYQRHLVRSERACRKQVEELYYYHALQKSETDMVFSPDELFNQENWYLWGLSKRQLLLAAGAAGGLAGGGAGVVLDAATGGLTGGLGTLAGGVGGALASARGALSRSDDIARWTIRGIPTGGRRLACGPALNPNFPFVLLGRALQHQRLVSQRTHAVRTELELGQPALEWLDEGGRRQLARIFEDLRRDRNAAQRRAELAELVHRWCVAVDPDRLATIDAG
jgi:hypothetical protein